MARLLTPFERPRRRRDNNDDRAVDAGELSSTSRAMFEADQQQQHPRFCNMANETKLSDLTRPGIQQPHKDVLRFPHGDPLLIAQAAGTPQSPASQAISMPSGRYRRASYSPEDRAVRGTMWIGFAVNSPPTAVLQENALRVALENQASSALEVLSAARLRRSKPIRSGAKYMSRALTPESLYLQAAIPSSRAVALFDKQYPQATDLLEHPFVPIRRAYLTTPGIAYLEQAKFQQALPAFRDAAKRAPNWSFRCSASPRYEQPAQRGRVRTTGRHEADPQYGFWRHLAFL